MKSKRKKVSLTTKKVWCSECINNDRKFRNATFMVPLRSTPYELASDGFNINKKMFAVCDTCLTHLNDFQRRNCVKVDPNNPHLVYSS